MNSRRRFLGAALAGAGWVLAAPTPAVAARRARFDRDPFTLGVASGYPRADGMVLWTRLAPEPYTIDGGAGWADLTLDFEIAEDPSFRRRVQSTMPSARG